MIERTEAKISEQGEGWDENVSQRGRANKSRTLLLLERGSAVIMSGIIYERALNTHGGKEILERR